jgi:hypothetical protein
MDEILIGSFGQRMKNHGLLWTTDEVQISQLTDYQHKSGSLAPFVAGTALTELLATAVLGIVALSQVHHSCGRYRGYGLATFALLMCPLLLLSFGACYVGSVSISRGVPDDTASLSSPPQLEVLTPVPPSVPVPPTAN